MSRKITLGIHTLGEQVLRRLRDFPQIKISLAKLWRNPGTKSMSLSIIVKLLLQ